MPLYCGLVPNHATTVTLQLASHQPCPYCLWYGWGKAGLSGWLRLAHRHLRLTHRRLLALVATSACPSPRRAVIVSSYAEVEFDMIDCSVH